MNAKAATTKLELTLADLEDIIGWMMDQPQETLDRALYEKLYDARRKLLEKENS